MQGAGLGLMLPARGQSDSGCAESQPLPRIMRLVFKAHRLCVSLNSRLESNEEEERES